MDILCDAPDDSSSIAQANCSCTVISVHFIEHEKLRVASELVTVFFFVAESGERPNGGVARRRRERMMRSWFRHEQQSIRMALATTGCTPSTALQGARTQPPGPALRSARRTPRHGARSFLSRWHAVLRPYDESVPGTRPDRLADVRPQERVLRHTVEQMADRTPVVPMLEAPVQKLGCSVVGSALGRWEPLPPHARVRPVLEHAAGHRRDQARVVEARHRTAVQVMAWFAAPVRSATLTWAEMRFIASLMPRYWMPEACAGATDPGADRGGGGSGGWRPCDHAARVPAVQVREPGGASVPVHRQSAGDSSCDLKRVSAVQNCSEYRQDSMGTVLGMVCNDRCLEMLWRFRSCSQCSSWRLLTRPLLLRRQAPVLVQTVQKTLEVLQLQFIDAGS